MVMRVCSTCGKYFERPNGLELYFTCKDHRKSKKNKYVCLNCGHSIIYNPRWGKWYHYDLVSVSYSVRCKKCPPHAVCKNAQPLQE